MSDGNRIYWSQPFWRSLFNIKGLRREAGDIYDALNWAVGELFAIPILVVAIVLAFPWRFLWLVYGKFVGVRKRGSA